MRKSKRMWKTVEENDAMLDFLDQLGKEELTALHKEAQKFICKMYGNKDVHSVDELWAKLFWRRLTKTARFLICLYYHTVPQH